MKNSSDGDFTIGYYSLNSADIPLPDYMNSPKSRLNEISVMKRLGFVCIGGYIALNGNVQDAIRCSLNEFNKEAHSIASFGPHPLITIPGAVGIWVRELKAIKR